MKTTSLAIVVLMMCVQTDTKAQNIVQHKIIGTWHGTSLCMDKAVDQRCKDEEVLYIFKPIIGFPDSVTLNASKIVQDTLDWMGDLGFRRVEGTNRWESDLSGRRPARWSFDVRDSVITGTLVELPSMRLIRRVWVGRK